MVIKKKHPEGIKNVLNKVIENIERRSIGKKKEILEVWRKAAGEEACGHSKPVRIRRKILTIEVDSSTWFYVLNIKKKNLLKSIKKELGEEKIVDIRFRMGWNFNK